MLPRVLTLYFTRDESTFSEMNLRSVIDQIGVSQDIYVISARPIDLYKRGFRLLNIVISTKTSWPIPLRIAYSFNAAIYLLSRMGIDIDKYEYLFKVDGDVYLPLDYLYNLISQRQLVGGFGAAMLISTKFYRYFLGGRYPINYCDDGYILAYSIAVSGQIAIYRGKGSVEIPRVEVVEDREFLYGMEYYKWGLPFFLLIVLPFTRIYLKITRRMKRYQEKPLISYLHNFAGYVRAFINRDKKYRFHRDYAKMRVLHLYHRLIGG